MSFDVQPNGLESSLDSSPSKRNKRKHDANREASQKRRKRQRQEQNGIPQAAPDRSMPLQSQALQNTIQREWEDLSREDNGKTSQASLSNGFGGISGISHKQKEKEKKQKEKISLTETGPHDQAKGDINEPNHGNTSLDVAEPKRRKKQGRREREEVELVPDSQPNAQVNGNGSILEEEKRKKRKQDQDENDNNTEPTTRIPQAEHNIEDEVQVSENGEHEESLDSLNTHGTKMTEMNSRRKKKRRDIEADTNSERLHESIEHEPQTYPDDEHEENQPVYNVDDDAAGVDSPFYQTRLSLCVPVPPIAISTSSGLSSVITEHLSPLLLTYSPAARGTILAFSDPSISTYPPSEALSSATPTSPVFAVSAEEYGASWVWLTATFLVFSPTRAQTLHGHVTVCGSSFISLTLYNLFLVSIKRNRIPASWTWTPSAQEASGNSSRKPNRSKWRMDDNGDDPVFSSSQATLVSSMEEESGSSSSRRPASRDTEADSARSSESEGYFTRSAPDGTPVKVSGFLRFHVVDWELVPGAKGQGQSLRIDGTLLDPQDEEEAVEAERKEWERVQEAKRRKVHRERGKDRAVMSGALVDADRTARGRRSRSMGVPIDKT